jgi:hypothetical protein
MSRNFLRWLPILVIALGARGFLPLSADAAAATPGFQPPSTWVNVTGNLANMPSECGNLTLVSAVPGSDRIIAGVARRGLWFNSTGSTWSHLGDGGSTLITNRPSRIAYDPDPARAGTFWESGSYDGGGIYKTIDNGHTFQQLGSISHNDYVGVDFSDPSRQTLLAAGHEQPRTVWRSTNGGQSWTNVGAGLPENTGFWSIPLIINSQTHVAPSSSGLYRTTNGGSSWQQVHTSGALGPPLVTSNGTIYWGNSSGRLLKSTDAGLTWTQVGSNLRVLNTPVVEMPDGALAAVGTDRVMISADGGANWSAVGPAIPVAPGGLAYSPTRQAFFLSHWDCGGVVPPDAVMRLDYASSTTPTAPPAPGNFRIISSQPPI